MAVYESILEKRIEQVTSIKKKISEENIFGAEKAGDDAFQHHIFPANSLHNQKHPQHLHILILCKAKVSNNG